MSIENYDLLNTPLTWFVSLNLLLATMGSAALGIIYFRHRYLFVKPSLVLLLLTHLSIQWPATILSGYFESFLPKPLEFAALVHGFVLLGILGSVFTFRSIALTTWNRIISRESGNPAHRPVAIGILLFCALILAGMYLRYVPIQCTGLYALLVDPNEASLFREISFKLLENPVPKYALAVLSATIAPLMTAIVAAELLPVRNQTAPKVLYSCCALVTVWLLAMLSGEKGILVFLSLTIVATHLWLQRLTITPLQVPVLFSAALAPAIGIAIILSISTSSGPSAHIDQCFTTLELRPLVSKGELVETLSHTEQTRKLEPPAATPRPSIEVYRAPERNSASEIEVEVEVVNSKNGSAPVVSTLHTLPKQPWIIQNFSSQASHILYRAVVVPLEVGSWYVHYQQTFGALGIKGLRLWQKISGGEEIVAPYMIGAGYGPAYYGRDIPQTLYASTGYLFAYISYFGLHAMLIALLLLLLIDIPLLGISHIPDKLLLPSIGALDVACWRFLDVDYTTALLTGGFAMIAIIAIILGKLVKCVTP